MRLKFTKNLSFYSAITLAVGITACGKKSDGNTADNPAVDTGAGTGSNTSPTESTTPGITASSSNQLVLSGQLALSGLGLMGSEQAALVYQFSRGEIIGQAQEVSVDSSGKFSATIPKADEAVELLVQQANLPREQRDWEKMAVAARSVTNGEGNISADYIKNMPEEEIQAGIGNLAKELKDAGRMTLIVAYDKSGDKKSEAQSFRFVSLQTPGGKNLSSLPNDNLKGNVNFGKITGSSADVTSEVKAVDALDISTAAIETFADMGRVLKSVKNNYMNDKWSVTPFYFWKGGANGFNNVIDQWSDATTSEYNGYGFYVPSVGDQGLSHADVCGGKLIEFAPPGNTLTLKNQDNTERTISKFTNTGTSPATDGSGTCTGGSDYYARRDEYSGRVSYMLNFGTGGSIQNSPLGLWTMNIDGVEVGRFDLASSMPVDENRKPLVLIPQARFNSSNGNIVSVDVELFRWTGSAYEKVIDLAPVQSMFKAFEASITSSPNNTESRTPIKVQADGTLKGIFDSTRVKEDGQPINAPVAINSITGGFAIYYEVGSASYRIEFR